MKAVICLLALVAGANAGLLVGGLGLGLGGIGSGGIGVNGGWSSGGWTNGGWSGGYGGGWNTGNAIVNPEIRIIKLVEAPAPVVQHAPLQIVKVIHQAHPIVSPALKIVKIIEKPSYGWA